MKRTIENPCKVNHTLYIRLSVLFLVTLAVSFGINTLNFPHMPIVAKTVENLSYSCIASVLVAWLIDCANIRKENQRSNKFYDTVYGDLRFHIGSFLGVWAQLCKVAFKDKDYGEVEDTWIGWYETVKLNYYKADAIRREEILSFFRKELESYMSYVKKDIESIENQKFMLTVNSAMNDEIQNILSDFAFEFTALEYSLERCGDDFWAAMDAINSDLFRYVENWPDIRYYNSLKSVPFEFGRCKQNVIRAYCISEANHIIEKAIKKK